MDHSPLAPLDDSFEQLDPQRQEAVVRASVEAFGRHAYKDASTDDMLELLVGSVLPTVLIIGAFMFFMNQFAAQQGRQMNFGKTQARTNDPRLRRPFPDHGSAEPSYSPMLLAMIRFAATSPSTLTVVKAMSSRR